jgi:outer membrane biosynthesis protein TonB
LSHSAPSRVSTTVSDNGIEGLIHISELSKDRVSKPEEIVHPGDKVVVKIISTDPGTRKIGLSLKQYKEDLEEKDISEYGGQGFGGGVSLGEVAGLAIPSEVEKVVADLAEDEAETAAPEPDAEAPEPEPQPEPEAEPKVEETSASLSETEVEPQPETEVELQPEPEAEPAQDETAPDLPEGKKPGEAEEDASTEPEQ